MVIGSPWLGGPGADERERAFARRIAIATLIVAVISGILIPLIIYWLPGSSGLATPSESTQSPSKSDLAPSTLKPAQSPYPSPSPPESKTPDPEPMWLVYNDSHIWEISGECYIPGESYTVNGKLYTHSFAIPTASECWFVFKVPNRGYTKLATFIGYKDSAKPPDRKHHLDYLTTIGSSDAEKKGWKRQKALMCHGPAHGY